VASNRSELLHKKGTGKFKRHILRHTTITPQPHRCCLPTSPVHHSPRPAPYLRDYPRVWHPL
jgi:hypothetical protein